MKPVGHISSVFKEKFGTPRQFGFASNGFGRLKMETTLEGFTEGMYVWLLFVFHLDLHCSKQKIKPPKLGGQKLGVFATRSPHRPNPIGLSLGRIEKVDEDSLILSGIDLVDGTPILDVKPYIPGEKITGSSLVIPEWLE